MIRLLIMMAALAACAGCGMPTLRESFEQTSARCMAAVRDDDLRKAHADCRYASSNAEQYSSLGTPALRSDLLLQHGRALRAANAHLPNLDHHVVTQIESSLRESLKREEAATPRDDRRVGLRLMELANFYWTRKRFADGQPYAIRLKPLLASYSADERIGMAALVESYEKVLAERTQRAEAARAAGERAKNEFLATIAARSARENKAVPARVEDPGLAIVWCVSPMPIGDSAVVSAIDVERSLGHPAGILSIQGDRAFICENTAAGQRIIAWREWACRGPATSRLQFASCVLTRWDDGVPEAFAPGQDEGKLLRSFPQTIRSTVTESQSGKLRGAALFEPPKWQPRWP